MATPPKVQPLSDIMAGLEPAYADSRGVQRKRQKQIPGRYDAQRQGLQTQKQNEFRDINRGANAKGLAFSGIPIEEQTRYLGEEYLPTMGQYDQQENDELMAIEESLAGLNKEQRLQATDMRSTQQERRQSFLESQRARKQERRLQQQRLEAERQRQQERLAAERQQAASERQYNQSQRMEPRTEVDMMLAEAAGSDGNVHPNDWARIAAYAHSQGIGFGGDKGFASSYWDYANEDHWREYQQGFERYM